MAVYKPPPPPLLGLGENRLRQGQEADGVEEEEALGEVEAEEEELVLGVELANVGNEVVLEAPDTEAGMEELLARISAALVVS
jgi:hypothetical protein